MILRNASLNSVLDTFANSDYNNYPVVDKEERLLGIITAESIRAAFKHKDLENLVVAEDIMEPVITYNIRGQDLLRKANEYMDRHNFEYLPIVTDESKIVGFIGKRIINKFISTRLMEIEQKIKSLEK
ncbi:MAG: CBS domain-containing protein [Candidatus Omnitrophica bacterium]|nr:CBS domain-containing protein [Candidatus Omnitrophota bacterium]